MNPESEGIDDGVYVVGDDEIGDEEEDEEFEAIDDELIDDDLKVASKNPKKRSRKKYARQPPPPPPVSHSALDDLDEIIYEDRVDEWIENGIQSMREMKEADKNETPPGEEMYAGGLVVPAWINDRLFPYQRTGLKWMWELHSQESGGMIGDEMFSKTRRMLRRTIPKAYSGCFS